MGVVIPFITGEGGTVGTKKMYVHLSCLRKHDTYGKY